MCSLIQMHGNTSAGFLLTTCIVLVTAYWGSKLLTHLVLTVNNLSVNVNFVCYFLGVKVVSVDD